MRSVGNRSGVRTRGMRTVGVVAVALGGLLAAACGGGGGGDKGSAQPSASESPKSGGILSFAEFSAPPGLDPIVAAGTGTVGQIEMTAVFDTLLRYNTDTGKYEPGTADSVTANADSTQWTIKIHPGIKFSDGTDYDADAVAFGLNRQRSGSPGAPPCAQYVACPRNASTMATGATFITDITVVDPTTVKVTLKQPFTAFPAVLAAEGGLIGSPTAIKKCDASAPASQCAFNTAPVGAGPFMVTSFKPGEAITMVRNPDYWAGPVHLDGLRFVDYKDTGGRNTLNALETGQVQAAFLQNPDTVQAAEADKVTGIPHVQYAATALLLNTAPGAATSSLLVRQAVAAAIDPKVINQRAYDGKGQTSSQLFTPGFRWYPDVPGIAFDADKARTLVAQAKAAGWDGKIRVLVANAPTPSNTGLAVQALLQNVGMTVALDNTKDVVGLIGQVVKGEYDVVQSGLAVYNDDTAGIGLAGSFLSTSPGNTVKLKDPALDQAISDVFAATSDAAKKAAYGKVSTELNAQVPVIPLATFNKLIGLAPNVHGVRPDPKGSVNLAQAWLS